MEMGLLQERVSAAENQASVQGHDANAYRVERDALQQQVRKRNAARSTRDPAHVMLPKLLVEPAAAASVAVGYAVQRARAQSLREFRRQRSRSPPYSPLQEATLPHPLRLVAAPQLREVVIELTQSRSAATKAEDEVARLKSLHSQVEWPACGAPTPG